jgi:hypothetical protein
VSLIFIDASRILLAIFFIASAVFSGLMPDVFAVEFFEPAGGLDMVYMLYIIV